jgi:leader peptidase (prepilin peptidase) / N-methyltransferase
MASPPLLQILLGLIGLVVGSAIVFAAPRLVAYRIGERIPFPPVTVLVPLIGVWVARWRVLYSVAVEIACAGTFAALALRYGDDRRLLIAAGYSTLLIIIAYIDIDHRLVLNRLSYPGIVLALIGSIFWPKLGLVSALLGAGTGLAIFLVLQLLARGGMGIGDMKLALLIGAMRGFPSGVFNALLIGTVLGGLGGAFALIVLKRGRKSSLAYGPYLVAGGIISFFVSSP